MTPSFVARCGMVALLVSGAGCAAAGRPGEASSYLIVDSFVAASGATATTFGGTLGSDVQTMVNASINGVDMRVPTVFEDVGQVRFRLGMKNPSLTASAANFITVSRYRVVFRRADGRNTPGVDVPFGFDGAMTVTVGSEPIAAAFTLVRIQAKSESPLLALIGGGGAMAISTLAEITFYGTDQAGREVVATAHISVNFADWGDPE
jgi:hypothetical protein